MISSPKRYHWLFVGEAICLPFPLGARCFRREEQAPTEKRIIVWLLVGDDALIIPQKNKHHSPTKQKSTPIGVLFVLEVTIGFEPMDNGVADRGLTTWLRHQISWSGLRGSNPPPSPWQGRALPNDLNPQSGY